MGGGLESVASSAGCFVQDWQMIRQDVDSRDEVMRDGMSDW